MGNLFSENMIHDLLESHNFFKFGKKREEKKVGAKIKFIDKIIFLYFKFFSWKLIFSFPK